MEMRVGTETIEHTAEGAEKIAAALTASIMRAHADINAALATGEYQPFTPARIAAGEISPKAAGGAIRGALAGLQGAACTIAEIMERGDANDVALLALGSLTQIVDDVRSVIAAGMSQEQVNEIAHEEWGNGRSKVGTKIAVDLRNDAIQVGALQALMSQADGCGNPACKTCGNSDHAGPMDTDSSGLILPDDFKA